MNPELADLIREEIMDRYDIYDVVTLLDLSLEDVYDSLEDKILARVADLDLHSLSSLSTLIEDYDPGEFDSGERGQEE